MLFIFDTSGDHDISPSGLKIGTSVISALLNVHDNFRFFHSLLFQVRSVYNTNGQTDRQTHGQGVQCGLWDDRIIIYVIVTD